MADLEVRAANNKSSFCGVYRRDSHNIGANELAARGVRSLPHFVHDVAIEYGCSNAVHDKANHSVGVRTSMVESYSQQFQSSESEELSLTFKELLSAAPSFRLTFPLQSPLKVREVLLAHLKSLYKHNNPLIETLNSKITGYHVEDVYACNVLLIQTVSSIGIP